MRKLRFHPWRYRLKVRTEPSQGSNPGSSPGIATNEYASRFATFPRELMKWACEDSKPASWCGPSLLYVTGFNSLLFEVLLVVFLGPIKLRSRSDLGHDRPLKHSFFSEYIL